ncbi:MAG: hypothetical protein ACLPSW_18360 [Roseiarcus sp.]
MPILTHSRPPAPPAALADAFPLKPIPSMAAQGLDGKSRLVAGYFGGATHIFEFCKPLGITGFKFGVTACRDPTDRICDLRRSRYGELFKRPNDPDDAGILLPNAHEWFLAPVSQDHLGSAALPDTIEIVDGFLRIRVPVAVSVKTVDVAVHALLRARSLRAFLASAEGRQRLIRAGHDPDRWFHTAYRFVDKTPHMAIVDELYLIRPRKELGALVSALTRLLQTWWAPSASRITTTPSALPDL